MQGHMGRVVGAMCECEVCKKWDRVLCGECTLRKFSELESRLARIERIVEHHSYIGVPEQFKAIRSYLAQIVEMLGAR